MADVERKVTRATQGAAVGALVPAAALVLVWATNGFGPLDMSTAQALGTLLLAVVTAAAGAFGGGYRAASPTSTVSTGYQPAGGPTPEVPPAPGGGGTRIVADDTDGDVR
jgi:hypothetical protein